MAVDAIVGATLADNFDDDQDDFTDDDFREVLAWLTDAGVDVQSSISGAVDAVHSIVAADPDWQQWWESESHVDRLGLLVEMARQLAEEPDPNRTQPDPNRTQSDD